MSHLHLSPPDAGQIAITEAVIVLPNGERRVIDITELQTFADLKHKIELVYGLPYELQRIRLTNCPQLIADWIPLAAIYQQENTEVFVQVDHGWTTFIHASLRHSNEKLLGLLEVKEGKILFENRLHVALLVAVATDNEKLWKYLLKLGPNICKRTGSGRGLLHIAVQARSIDCIKSILEISGASLIDFKDTMGESPLALAEKTGFTEAIDAFQQYKSEGNLNKIDKPELVSRSSKNPQISHQRSRSAKEQRRPVSTPNSPRLGGMKRYQLLDREKAYKTLINSSSIDASNSSTDDSVRLPSIARERPLNFTAPLLPMKTHLTVVANRKSHSLSAPVSPASNTSTPEFVQSSIRKKSENEDRNYDTDCSEDWSLKVDMPEQKPLGVRQVVFLPPWRRGGMKQKEPEKPEQILKSEDQLEVKDEGELEAQQPKRAYRSHSLATISPEELQSIDDNNRTKKPWNDWRRISMVARNERDTLIRQMQNRSNERKKSFDIWFVEKEIMREELTARMIEEERMKRLEKEKLEEERKMRCKTYGKWLAEKEIEAEETKDAEKRREVEKRFHEDKLQMRKEESERKYEKWMREKYEEELRKEEELDRLLQEKWKIKQEKGLRRKSVAPTTNLSKQKLSKTNSLPLV